jgi:hypothetical protein
MLNHTDADIDIQFGPVKMAGAWFFNIQDFSEPGKFVERKEVLLSATEQPESVRRDVCHLRL